MDKLWNIHHEIVLSSGKEQTPHIHDNMWVVTYTHTDVDPNKSDTGESILCDSVYIHSKNRENRSIVFKGICLDGKTTEKNKNMIITQVRVGEGRGGWKGPLGAGRVLGLGGGYTDVCTRMNQ